MAKRRSVAFLISDFLASGYEPALRVAVRRHDVVPVTLTDPFEEELPDLGIGLFEDPETGRIEEFDTAARRKQARRARLAKAEREQFFKRLKLDWIDVRTNVPYLPALIAFFRTRAARLHH